MFGQTLTAFFILTLALLTLESQAGVCNRRSTVVQIKIPNRTNVSVNYPNQAHPVNFVPYPYANGGNVPIYTCQNGICQKTNRPVSSLGNNQPPPVLRTNIIVQINGKKPPETNGTDADNDPNSELIEIQNNSTATSQSTAVAKGSGTAVATSAAASTTNTDVIAKLEDEPGNGPPTDTILVDSNSDSSSKSTAKATAGATAAQNDKTSGNEQQSGADAPGNTSSASEQSEAEPKDSTTDSISDNQISTPDMSAPAQKDQTADSETSNPEANKSASDSDATTSAVSNTNSDHDDKDAASDA